MCLCLLCAQSWRNRRTRPISDIEVVILKGKGDRKGVGTQSGSLLSFWIILLSSQGNLGRSVPQYSPSENSFNNGIFFTGC